MLDVVQLAARLVILNAFGSDSDTLLILERLSDKMAPYFSTHASSEHAQRVSVERSHEQGTFREGSMLAVAVMLKEMPVQTSTNPNRPLCMPSLIGQS